MSIGDRHRRARLSQIFDLLESSVLLARFDVSTLRGYSNHETTHPLKIAERWPTIRFLAGFPDDFALRLRLFCDVSTAKKRHGDFQGNDGVGKLLKDWLLRLDSNQQPSG
jgi:hypothetical protein